MATKLYRRSGFGDSDEKPDIIRKFVKEDWERFLYSMCRLIGIKFDWVSLGSMSETFNDDIPATLVSKYFQIHLNALHLIEFFFYFTARNRKYQKF